MNIPRFSGWILMILTALALPGPGPYAYAEQTNAFYFVQITDTHWGDRDNIERTEQIVEMINSLPFPIECVVHTGDITSDLIDSEKIVSKGMEALSRLDVPVHFVAGNHDILEGNPEKTRQAFKRIFGPPVRIHNYSDLALITVYTEPLAESFSLPGFDPLELLESALESLEGKSAIVFHHQPSVPDFYNNQMHPGWTEESRKKWTDLLNAHNVEAVLAGHFHRDEMHWLGSIPLYVCPPVAGYWKRQAAFRIFEYRNGKLSYRTQYLE